MWLLILKEILRPKTPAVQWGRRAPKRAFLQAAALALLVCSAALAQSGPVVARAAGVTGQAILISTGAAPAALTPGFILSPGDRIDTRLGGRVVIDLSDGSMVVVSPGSLVTLKDYRNASSLRELFEITLGMVRVKINHYGGKPNPYRMNSPTASIAVRGTEFTIEVDQQGATNVTVIEGSVEVSSLADPARTMILQAGQSFRLIAGIFAPPPANRGDDHRGEPPAPNFNMGQAHGPDGHPDGFGPIQVKGPPPPPMPAPNFAMPHNDREPEETSPRANAGTYDRYLAGLADIGQVPFLLRFNAFSESHLDALENPAYATTFRSPEGRLFFLPTFHGAQTLQENQSTFGPAASLPGDYSVSPQISFFAPAGGFTLGGSAGLSHLGSGGTASTFYSGSLVGARRYGANSFGLELATLKGTGSGGPGISSSDVSQTRLTLGYSRDFSHGTKLGVYYRYALIDASDRDAQQYSYGFVSGLEATRTGGHSSEVGLRVRGAITPRLSYGLAASWLGISLFDGMTRYDTSNSHQRDRSHRGAAAFGLGYALTPRTVLTFDLAGGASRNTAFRNEDATGRVLQRSAGDGRFAALHAAVQHDVTRRLFASATFLQVWPSNGFAVSVFPDRFGRMVQVTDSFFPLAPATSATRFSDFGAGWRFTRDLLVQYIYSTDYGFSPATHSVMLRYTFGKPR
jgi:hypothetical protein